MSKFLINIFIVFVVVYYTQCVIITHVNNDIRSTIMHAMNEKPIKEQFKVFHLIYNKEYDLNSEFGIQRYRVFKQNVNLINSHNEKNLSYKVAINSMADLTEEEFKKSMLSTVNPENLGYFLGEDQNGEINTDETISQTAKIDWTPYLVPAKNQGRCGSCWAFAAIGAIEGNYNIIFKQPLEFSEQELVDCDNSNLGCNGGSPNLAYNYIIKNQGISYYNAYPYTGIKAQCKTNLIKNNVLKAFQSCNYNRCDKVLWRSLLAKGPIVVVMDADGDSVQNQLFRFYSGGIIESDMTCDGANHAVVAVGVDSDEKGEYIVARNSWGSDWGVSGNFKIRIRNNDNTCYMQSSGLLPIVQQTINPVPPAPKPSCMKLYSQCQNKGNVREICQNTPKIEVFPMISGFNLGKYKSARLYYQSEYCKGAYYVVNSSFDCLKDSIPSLVNSIKSIVVDELVPPTGCVWFYSDYCLSGPRIEICNNVTDLSATQFNFSNRISAFKIGPGVKSISCYTNINYMGTFVTTSSDSYGLFGSPIDKKIISVKINK